MAQFTNKFQSGLRLRLLAEHRSYCTGYLCAKSAYTKLPRYHDTTDYSNHVELPICYSGIPHYIIDIIKRCRERGTLGQDLQRIACSKTLPTWVK